MNRRKDPGRYTDTERSPTFEARFWSKVEKRGEDECWPWKAHLTSKGYGELYYGGGDNAVNIQGHQASWLLHGGTLPTWPMVLDHTCRERTCTNPKHLRIVSQRINTIENSESWWAKNHRKTECKRGHPFTPENTALYQRPGKSHVGRVCLTCWPSYWKWAIVPRTQQSVKGGGA